MIKNKLKRITAFLLASVMGIAVVSPASAITSYGAASELIPKKLKDNGGGTTTAYKWLSNGTYDIEGIKFSANVGADDPYQGTDAGGITTTYSHGGYMNVMKHSGNLAMRNMTLVPNLNMSTNGAVGYDSSSKVEYSIQLKPSPDEKWIIVEYTIHNRSDSIIDEFYFGARADIQIGSGTAYGPADTATVKKSEKGFHMVNEDTNETFDFIIWDEQLGIDKPSVTGMSSWVGKLDELGSNIFNNTPDGTTFPPPTAVSPYDKDSALAYSWKVKLEPRETITRRAAFGAKGPSYYVSKTGSDSGLGTYDDPFKTIEHALLQMGSSLGYIYVHDYDPIEDTIIVGNNVTIMSSDYDRSGNPITYPPNLSVPLKRANSLLDPMFETSGNGVIRFGNIILDGNKDGAVGNDSPMVKASTGTIGLQVGAVLENNQVTSSNIGSAIDISGTANLDINFGEVKDNISAGGGAVRFDGNIFTIRNEVKIQDNKTDSGKDSNVYLGQNKFITITDELTSEAGAIGITTKQPPLPGANVTVVSDSNSASVGNPSYYTVQFKSDESNYYIDNSGKNVVLKCNGHDLEVEYVDENGLAIGTAPAKQTYAFGQTITQVDPPAGGITGYTLDETIIEPSASTLLVQNTDPGKGKVTGTMPDNDVRIIYKYKRNQSSISFYSNGGLPRPDALQGVFNDPVSSMMPNVIKYGFIFEGWYTNPSFSGSPVSILPDKFPLTALSYYAKWKQNTSITFDYSVLYQNATGLIRFQDPAISQIVAGDPILAQYKNVPSYKLVSKGVTPEKAYRDPLVPNSGSDVGQFLSPSNNFTGEMPNETTVVNYTYDVDRSNPANKKELTIRHMTRGGVQLEEEKINYFPEDGILAAPKQYYQYRLFDREVTGGGTPDPSNMIYAVSGSFAADHKYVGQMPNQDVEITYTYEPTGDGYEFLVNYIDRDANDVDVIPPSIVVKQADETVTAQFETIYGYNFGDENANPAGWGTFDGSHNYAGVMRNNDLTITYGYVRNLSDWVTLTYKSDPLGSLNSSGVSNEVVSGGGAGNYQTMVIKNDGLTAADARGYAWAEIQNRNLIPNAVPNQQYYRFAGWYGDLNLTGQMEKVEDSQRFKSDITLTAHYEENPEWWIDIYLEAGANGSIPAPHIIHTTKDQTWGDILSQLPAGVPVPNYLATTDWYQGARKVENGDLLENGKTYTLQFERDPNSFGTGVQTPDALGSVDVDGSGKITVYDTSEGYKYVVVDSDGNVVAVEEGSSVSDRLVFPGLYPGSRYDVYEVIKDTAVSAGDSINTIPGLGTPKNVLIPVVENNVIITYDEEEDGKTQIIIDPADPDTDYALLDENGNIVSGWQTPDENNPVVVFPNLDYDKEYIVVSKPRDKNVTPESKVNDGTTLVTDPGGMLEIPTFIVETINGKVVTVGEDPTNTDRQTGIEKGTVIKLEAEATNASGENFLYWKIIVGNVPGFGNKVTSKEVSFLMPDTNLVVCAYYDRADNGNANVVDEVRGGNENEMALDPDEVERLETELTTNKDLELIGQNGADVTYKVVFNKNKAKGAEVQTVKSSGYFEPGHEDSITGAWGLDVTIERYVDGRKVARATPSDASFDVIIQLDKEDVDMLDYLLVEIDNMGNVLPVAMDPLNPEDSGGLFRFTANEGKRYVLVYSKAYYITFLNEIQSKKFDEILPVFYSSFKVRKDEFVTYGNYYDSKYQVAEIQSPILMLEDKDGVQHDFNGWSLKNMPENFKTFVENNPIKKKTIVYAYYENNRPGVIQKRDELEQLIYDATDLSNQYFLSEAEANSLKEDIRKAQIVFDQVEPRKANYDELQQAIDLLRSAYDLLKEVLNKRNNEYNNKKNTGGGGGGSGSGSKADPFISKKSNVYRVGTNGNWKLVDQAAHQWSFVLNGGISLSSMWAYLEFTHADASKTGWYHFNGNGIMNSGWFQDEKSDWYYCDTIHDGWYGKMKTGWHYDEGDQNWYYLDSESGTITKGWKEIGGKWYCFAAYNPNPAYQYDIVSGQWILVNPNAKPLGSMYKSERTPDGYYVDANGAWID